MRSAQEAVDALCRLSAADREWILGALSAEARAKLKELAAAPQQGGPPRADDHERQEPEGSSAQRALIDASPAIVVSRLAAEPAWILALVLTLTNWPWQDQLLTGLPADKRLEVAQQRARLPPVSTPLRGALLRALSAQLLAAPAADEHPPFEHALVRARMRTRRRPPEAGAAR
jgi:hypothetical protein